jgi:MoxR-like ATPase
MATDDIPNFVDNCYKLKPSKLYMTELKWKYLVRSVLRGKNTMLLGPAGQGKTFAIQCVVKALGREKDYFYLNMGATQDPRATLIGNTHFNKESGTIFDESPFVKAIRTPNTIIHLDELSRAHPDAWNILLTPIDYIQRYLRLDEKMGSELVHVAKGVSFIGTANVGNEYTATRVMDRALMDRFPVKIEVDIPDEESEADLVREHVPEVSEAALDLITKIAKETRDLVNQSKLTKFISTRAVVEMAELSVDGFEVDDIAEVVIYPEYPDDGGVDSERTLVKQVVQKHVPADAPSTLGRAKRGKIPNDPNKLPSF